MGKVYMSERAITALAQNWGFVVYIFAIIALVSFVVTLAAFLGGKAFGRNKNTPFEAGQLATGNTKIRFSAKFYLVAMLFVIFDIEALFLFSWAVSLKKAGLLGFGWSSFIEAIIFVFVLLVGLIYILRLGVMNWAPQNNRQRLNEFNK